MATEFRFELNVDVDEDQLAEHVHTTQGANPPYETDVSKWDPSDLLAAHEEGIIDLGETGRMIRVEQVGA